MSSSVAVPADRDPQRAVGVDPHRLEHRRRFERLGGARAARVGGDAGPVEAEQHGLRLDAGDAEAHEVGQPALARVAVDDHAVEVADRGEDTVGQAPLLGRLAARAGRRRRARAAAAPKPAMAGRFSMPARRARSWSPPRSSGSMPQAPPDQQRADARRAAELVGADRQQVGPEGPEVDRHPAGGLGRVDVHEHAPLAAGRHHLGDRLDGAHLVVAPLEVDERGVGRRSRRAARRVDPADLVHPDGGDRARRGPPTRGPPSARPPAPPARSPRSATPRQPVAIDSVAPLVNTTSRGRAPRSRATASRASSTATRAVMPSAWIRPGSPARSPEPADHRVARLGPEGRRGGVVEVVAVQQFAAP